MWIKPHLQTSLLPYVAVLTYLTVLICDSSFLFSAGQPRQYLLNKLFMVTTDVYFTV